MTYNIRHGVGMDRVLDLERTARVIRSGHPDLVILNEVDHGTARSFGVGQADSLGRLLGMTAVFGRSIDYDGGQYGNALLSRFPILDFNIIDLSVDRLLEGRSLLVSRIAFETDTLVLMGTHLGLELEERRIQIDGIMGAIPKGQPVILAGDLNLEPDSELYASLTDKFTDGVASLTSKPEPTFPADKPLRRIDYIFVNKAIDPLAANQFSHPELHEASDHRPQVLTFRF